MARIPLAPFALALVCLTLVAARAQDPESQTISSDDITVAGGLQLPTYGHIWAMDTWKGVKELVQLHSPPAEAPGFSLKFRHTVEIKGEAARVRLHDVTPQIFVHGVSGGPGSKRLADYLIVRLEVEGQRRQATKLASSAVTAEAKGKLIASADVIQVIQQRIGSTDWYRLTPQQPLEPAEYALVPVPGSADAVLGEIYDFAVDPEARENARALRSEENRQSE